MRNLFIFTLMSLSLWGCGEENKNPIIVPQATGVETRLPLSEGQIGFILDKAEGTYTEVIIMLGQVIPQRQVTETARNFGYALDQAIVLEWGPNQKFVFKRKENSK